MTAFTTDALPTYGGALNDYSPVVDPTTDRPAAGANASYAAVAGMTHTAIRAWARFTWNATTVTLVAHDALWGNTLSVAPVVAHTGTGIVTVTWPTTVQDEIPVGAPGYTGPLPLNLRAGFGNLRVVATAFDVFVTPTSANVATVKLFNVAGTIADTGVATDLDVFMI